MAKLENTPHNPKAGLTENTANALSPKPPQKAIELPNPNCRNRICCRMPQRYRQPQYLRNSKSPSPSTSTAAAKAGWIPRTFSNTIDQIARHGMIDIDISCKGDPHIDDHHTAEDIGITLTSNPAGTGDKAAFAVTDIPRAIRN